MNNSSNRHPSSYRDPAGFVFEQDGVIYRQVNSCYSPQYDHLMSSGLYEKLVASAMIVSHEEIDCIVPYGGYKILKPDRIPFINYPYEWFHSQLQQAALLTLNILRLALQYGMTLKDATPYNIQFVGSRPVLIDTLSFELLAEDRPWVAYRQFCEMFLAPLALSHYCDQPIGRTLRGWPEGIPIKIASKLLSIKSHFHFNILLHLHLHARIGNKQLPDSNKKKKYARTKQLQIQQSLRESVEKCHYNKKASAWSSYYYDLEQRGEYFESKMRILHEWIESIGSVNMVLDAGSNVGHFSKLLNVAETVVALDADADSIESLFDKEEGILALHLDLCDLSSGQGLMSEERKSFNARGRFELVLALALFHHLSIGRQIPVNAVINLLAELTEKWLILEFVPMNDPWSELLIEAKAG